MQLRLQRGRACRDISPPSLPSRQTYRGAWLLASGQGELAVVLLASALRFPEFFTLFIVTQVKHLLDIFLIFYLGEFWGVIRIKLLCFCI